MLITNKIRDLCVKIIKQKPDFSTSYEKGFWDGQIDLATNILNTIDKNTLK